MLVDLGSGDGAIVCEAAQRGFHATGVELNPMLAWFSKLRGISQAGATINLGDMWKQPVSDADVVVVYGVESEDFQQRLTTKIRSECTKPGAILVSNCFPVPALTKSRGGTDGSWRLAKKPVQAGLCGAMFAP